MPGDEGFLSVDELARRFGVVPATIREWTRAGRIPALRCGRLWRYRFSDVIETLERRSAARAAAPTRRP